LVAEWRINMIDEIIKLREDGLSFRKIASELNTTVGKVQYRWNKWVNNQDNDQEQDSYNEVEAKDTVKNESPNEVIPLKGELQAKLISPSRIILIWEVTDTPGSVIRLYYKKRFEDLVQVVRIYDVTDIIFNGNNAHHFYEIVVPFANGYWFVKGLIANRNYIAEIGVKFNEKDFFPILRSNTIQTPPISLSNGSEIFHLSQHQQLENRRPKWVDRVSTYSYYGESNAMEKNNE
jgi:uncharacterized protein